MWIKQQWYQIKIKTYQQQWRMRGLIASEMRQVSSEQKYDARMIENSQQNSKQQKLGKKEDTTDRSKTIKQVKKRKNRNLHIQRNNAWWRVMTKGGNWPIFSRPDSEWVRTRAVRKSVFQTERKRKPNRFRVYGTETEIQQARKFTETERKNFQN